LLFNGKNGYANAPKYYVYTYVACLVILLRVISQKILNERKICSKGMNALGSLTP